MIPQEEPEFVTRDELLVWVKALFFTLLDSEVIITVGIVAYFIGRHR